MTNITIVIRQSARSLMRSRSFTVTAAVTLALGLGATTASLNLANKLLRTPLGGIRDQDQLIVIRSAPPPTGSNFAIPAFISAQQVEELVARLQGAGQIAGFSSGFPKSVALPGGRARGIQAQSVAGNFFALLGVAPALGSFSLPPELAAAGNATIISDQLWAGLFNRSPDVVGSTILINGVPETVIGVTPPTFHGIERLSAVDIWAPSLSGKQSYTDFVARLEPRITPGMVESHVKAIMGPRAEVFTGLGVAMNQRADVDQFVTLSLAGSMLVLLIACANVANLLLFRGLGRQAETAVHRALGASQSEILGKHLTEAMLLAVPAAAIGIPLSLVLTRMLGRVRLSGMTAPFGPLPVSWTQLGLAVAAAIVAAGLAGLIPAMVSARTEPLQGVQDHGRTRGGTRLRRAFATCQVALSLSLVVAMLLMTGTMARLRAIDLGFDPEGVLLLNTNPGDAAYEPEAARNYLRRFMIRLQAAPQFEQVAMARSAPLAGRQTVQPVSLTGNDEDQVRTRVNEVSDEYFDLLNLRLLEGRSFTPGEIFPDTNAATPIILSQSVAAAVFGDRPALGQPVFMSWTGRHTVVGIVEDSHWDNVEPVGGWVKDPRLIVFTPFNGPFPLYSRGPRNCSRNPTCGGTVLVRSRVPEKEAMSALRQLATEVDPLLPAYDVTKLTDVVDLTIADRIMLSRMMSVLALLATSLAAVGIYGMISYTVASRRRDIGIRIALGAGNGAVASHLLKEVIVVGGLGTAAGLGGAVALSGLIANHLYGVTALDGLTYALAVGLLLGIGLAAALPAIITATRVDPAVTLRADG